MIQLPNTPQAADYTCGAAAVLAICRYYGVGPETEAAVVADMGFGEDGSDPAHVLRAITGYGLHHREYRLMTRRQLERCLDRARPVLLMLQAWPERPPLVGFADVWDTGHWVVAIGYDTKGVYFEDPSLADARGFLAHDALAERWHDIEGADDHRVQHYGLALWRQRVVRTERLARVRPIQ